MKYQLWYALLQKSFSTNIVFNNQLWVPVVEFRKRLRITLLAVKKMVSVVEGTYIRTYFRKTNKTQNICTIGRGARNISIKKWQVIFEQTHKD